MVSLVEKSRYHYETLPVLFLTASKVGMSSLRIRIQTSAPSGTIVLDNAKTRNALSRETIEDLTEAFADFHREKSVRAVILTATGSTFCSGIDLKQWSEIQGSEESLAAWQDVTTELQELYETMLRFPKPIVVAIDGPVLGAGLGLVLASDLVVASKRASFASLASRVGLVSGLVAPLLAFRSGASVAARLLLHPHPVSAEQAYHWGLVHYLVDSGQIWAKGNEIVQDIAQSSVESMQMTKRLLNEMVGESTWSHLTSGAAVMATIMSTESASEGLKAFVEKRPTKFP
ncbi:Carnitinyl-CoA dehydratase [Pirellula sp. SH-Sr6A]|uniref:enoyl-CoA hydratase/isomerase family protein n=1 Tax=Pirellula sp. SH-Sr6A TaxID=1632865 RepID=UPI00078BCEC3|nr:enoyl-CoA hydratase/isomerase family protein [Pirellula sp. SH-Sr6A]AMV34912.1 Carnitinyl-CoA dehydratase [Pirellula sp. SH-Sr6A]